MLRVREHWPRKTTRREGKEGLGPLIDGGLREVPKLPREAKGVVGLGEREEGEWKRVVVEVVFVVFNGDGGSDCVGF